MYVVQQKDATTFHVGYFTPGGQFITAHDYPNEEDAVHRMRFLNGAPEYVAPPATSPPPAPAPAVAKKG